MRYPAAETAKKHISILDQAARLFRERGFSGVSVNEIMQTTGLTHGPFYNHFASKEALMAESIEHALNKALESFKEVPATAEARAKYLDSYLSLNHCRAVDTGCTIAALATDMCKQPQVREPFTAHLRSLIDAWTTRFPWRSKRTARAEAIQVLASMLGAIILARAANDEALSEEILRDVRQALP